MRTMLVATVALLWGTAGFAEENACPSVVQMNSTITTSLSKLPSDGWYAYLATSTRTATCQIACARIKGGETRKFGSTRGTNRLWFSTDGKWILYYDANSVVHLVRPDGTDDTNLGVQCVHASWFYASPKEDAAKGIYEFAVCAVNKTDVYAYSVNLSGTKPVLGAKRQIARGMPASGAVFSVSRDHIFWDAGGPCYIYTIPAGGMASGSTIYKSSGRMMCAQSLDRAGYLATANPDGPGCIPADHKGFYVVKVKSNTDPVVTFDKWLLDPASGAVSVNWAPANAWGKDTRSGSYSEADWNMWQFSNHQDWMIGVFNGTAGHGVWLIEWKTNTWICVAGPSTPARWPTIYFDTGSATGTRHSPVLREALGSAAEGTRALSNLLGRTASVAARAHQTPSTCAAGVLLDGIDTRTVRTVVEQGSSHEGGSR